MLDMTTYYKETVKHLAEEGRFTNGIAVVTDTGSDLSKEQAQEMGILVIPLQVILHGESYRDGIEITPETVVNKLNDGVSISTSMPLPSDAQDVLTALAENGINKVVFVSISSGVSGTFGMLSMLIKDNPAMQIEVFDTKYMSLAQGYIAIEAARLRDEGVEIGEFTKRLSDYRNKVVLYFLLPDLTYPIKSGRISHLAGLAGKALAIKPIFTLGDDGTVKSVSKSLGLSRAYTHLIDSVKSFTNGARFRATVMYAGNYDASLKAANMIKGIRGQLDVVLKQLGPTLSVHAGPEMMAVSICLEK